MLSYFNFTFDVNSSHTSRVRTTNGVKFKHTLESPLTFDANVTCYTDQAADGAILLLFKTAN
ncbi:hypothetical protein D3C86_2242110 [compost metagenome]